MARVETDLRFAALDGLRGVFAIAVVLFHINFATHFYALPIVRAEYLSVDFFFVLSGFVIAFAYAGRLSNGDTLRSFVIKRIGRVWPLHMVMLGCLVALEVAKLVVTTRLGIAEPSGMPFTGPNSPVALLTNAALLQSLDLHNTTTWNYPSWSISAELCAYLLFGLICIAAGRWALWIAGVIVVAAFATIVTLSNTGMDLTFHLGAVRGCLGFFLGWLAFAAFERRSMRGNSWTELAIAAAVIAYIAVAGRTSLGYFAPFLFALATYALASSDGLVTRTLKSAPLQFLGRISYSIYMVHAVVLTVVTLAAHLGEKVLDVSLWVPTPAVDGLSEGGHLISLGNAWTTDALAAAYLAVVLVLATLTYRYIEVPGIKLFGRLANARPQRAALGSAT